MKVPRVCSRWKGAGMGEEDKGREMNVGRKIYIIGRKWRTRK